MDKISVKLAQHPHDILVGYDVLGTFGNSLKRLNIGQSPYIITSTKIGRLYLDTLIRSLKSAGFHEVGAYVMPDGEKHKNLVQSHKILAKIAEFDNSQNKKLFIINLGGGVVGDLGGFVAATYHRGTPYVQVPTTLLAFVDCGVGGKVGVNLGKFKNCVGAFWHPKLVFADLSLLKTLSKRQFKSGLAEVIKYGISIDPDLLYYIEKNYMNILNLEKEYLFHISKTCYRIKVEIVEKDDTDTKDIRIVLNYGHTIGHAVESASKYSFTHGESVSIGMVCANDIAVKLGLLSKEDAERAEAILTKMNLPMHIKNCRIQDILESMRNDKKFVHGKNRFVLLQKIGKTVIREDIPVEIIQKVLKDRMAANL